MTGKRQVTIQGLFFNFVKPEELGGFHGALASISKATIVFTLDKKFEKLTGQFCEEMVEVTGGFYDPSTDNPLDTEFVPCPEGSGVPFTGQRIQ